MKSKCPCEECITNAICRIQAKENGDVVNFSWRRKCDPLFKYLSIYKLWKCNRILETREALGLPPYKKRNYLL